MYFKGTARAHEVCDLGNFRSDLGMWLRSSPGTADEYLERKREEGPVKSTHTPRQPWIYWEESAGSTVDRPNPFPVFTA